MRVIWTLGLVGGLVAGAVVLTDVPLLIKLVIGLAVAVVGVAGPLGSVLLAGLLLGAGLLTFVVLLATSEPAAVASALGVATLLIASGVAFSFRELFRDRTKSAAAPSMSRKALADRTAREPGGRMGHRADDNAGAVSSSLDDLAESVRAANNESE
jgi:uncharacterized membrane protein YccC